MVICAHLCLDGLRETLRQLLDFLPGVAAAAAAAAVALQPLDGAGGHLDEALDAVLVESRGPGRHPAALGVPRELDLGQDGGELLPRHLRHLQVLQQGEEGRCV